jgi:hypothetical protein
VCVGGIGSSCAPPALGEEEEEEEEGSDRGGRESFICNCGVIKSEVEGGGVEQGGCATR